MSITSREELKNQLKEYKTIFEEEEPFVEQFFELLNAESCYLRNYLPGHITGSAWITNHAKERILLIHHAKLDRWLQPGGHADGDENIFRVALREAKEETGLKEFKLSKAGIFDLDVHTIPARKDFPEHLHYDIRFIFEADDNEPLIISEESNQIAWTDYMDVIRQTGNNPSIVRMLKKIQFLP